MDSQEGRSEAGVNNDGLWTNEKHFNFLNRMEAIFVQTMLENNDASDMLSYSAAPLDRYLPDTSDSTRDLKRTRCTNNSSIPLNYQGSDTNSTNKVDYTNVQRRRRRRRRSGLVEASQDQIDRSLEVPTVKWGSTTRKRAIDESGVVPQVGNSKSDIDDENNEAQSRFPCT